MKLIFNNPSSLKQRSALLTRVRKLEYGDANKDANS